LVQTSREPSDLTCEREDSNTAKAGLGQPEVAGFGR